MAKTHNLRDIISQNNNLKIIYCRNVKHFICSITGFSSRLIFDFKKSVAVVYHLTYFKNYSALIGHVITKATCYIFHITSYLCIMDDSAEVD